MEFNYINIAAGKYAEANSNLYGAINNQYAFQLGKPFQVAGQRTYSVAVANRYVAFTENSYAETERNLFLEVAAKWLEAWTAQKQLDVLITAKSNIDSLVASNRHRYKHQVITQTDTAANSCQSNMPFNIKRRRRSLSISELNCVSCWAFRTA